MTTQYEVWGLASGKGSTKEAAPGAFTVRCYFSEAEYRTAIAQHDWRDILNVSRKQIP
jgi:hypothetical protein